MEFESTFSIEWFKEYHEELVPVKKHFSIKNYIDIVGTHVVPMFKRGNPSLLFMQDNDYVHKSKKVTKSIRIPTLEWPPKLTELNPI